MNILIRHVENNTFLAKSGSNHWIPLDTAVASGGTGAANDPFTLMLIGCGGCVSIDVVSILSKSRKTWRRMEIELTARRAETTPKILRELKFHIRADGDDLTFELLRRAVDLSLTKYCSVSLSLDRSVIFRAQITLNGEAGDEWQIPRDSALYDQ